MGTAAAQAVGMGTGKQGFFTYSAGAAIAKVASDNGLAMRIQPFGGTSAYVPAVNAREVDFGLANELETTYAVTGQAIYKGKQPAEVRAVSILTPLRSEERRVGEEGVSRCRLRRPPCHYKKKQGTNRRAQG